MTDDMREDLRAHLKTFIKYQDYFVDLLGTDEMMHLSHLYNYAADFGIKDAEEMLYRLRCMQRQQDFCTKQHGYEQISCGNNELKCSRCGHPESDLHDPRLPFVVKKDELYDYIGTLVQHRDEVNEYLTCLRKDEVVEYVDALPATGDFIPPNSRWCVQGRCVENNENHNGLYARFDITKLEASWSAGHIEESEKQAFIDAVCFGYQITKSSFEEVVQAYNALPWEKHDKRLVRTLDNVIRGYTELERQIKESEQFEETRKWQMERSLQEQEARRERLIHAQWAPKVKELYCAGKDDRQINAELDTVNFHDICAWRNANGYPTQTQIKGWLAGGSAAYKSFIKEHPGVNMQELLTSIGHIAVQESR